MTHSAAGQPDHDGDLDADPHPPSLSQSWPPPPPQAPTWAPQPQLRLISQRGEQAEASPQAAPLRSLGLTRPSITSDLDSELQAAREELHALHELLEELPSIFERKFQHRLQSALQDQKRLLSANQELHQQLARALPQGSIPVSKPTSRLMLPPALERAGTLDRKSTRLNSSHSSVSRMPSSA